MWAFSLEGRDFEIEGRILKVEEQFSEVLDRRMGQRHVLAKARNTVTRLSFFIKIRYELNPIDFAFEDPTEILSIAEQHYCHEVQAAMLLAEKGFGPKYAAHETQDQPEWMPFPGGYVDFLILHPPFGENVNKIQNELSNRQLASIRTQLARILETLRTNDYQLVMQHPSYLNYDAQTDKLYLIDLDGLAYTDSTSSTSFPVDEASPFVEAFNIWRAPYRKPTTAPGPEPVKAMPPSNQSNK